MPGLLVPFLAFGLGTWWLFRDEAPPDLSDFDAVPGALPDSDNAYLILRDAALELPPLPTDESGRPLLSPRDVLSGLASATPARFDAVLEPYDQLWPTLEAAAKAPGSQAPPLHRFTDTVPETANLRLMIDLALLRALRDAEAGQIPSAIAQAEQALHLSRQIEASHNTLLQLLLGQACVIQSLTCVRRVAEHATDPNDLISLASRLDQKRGDRESIAAAFRTEARVTARLLGAPRELLEAGKGTHDETDPVVRAGRFGFVFYKPHATQRVYADFMRESLALLDQPWDVVRQNPPQARLDRYVDAPFPARVFNLQGRILLKIIATAPSVFIRNRLQTEAWLDLTRLHLAARAHYLEHRRLPDRLDELTPRYLPALPVDPFTTRSFNYSVDARKLWSNEALDSNQDGSRTKGRAELAVVLSFSAEPEATQIR